MKKILIYGVVAVGIITVLVVTRFQPEKTSDTNVDAKPAPEMKQSLRSPGKAQSLPKPTTMPETIPLPKLDLSSVPSHLVALFDQDSSYITRYQVVDKLGKDLPVGDINALLMFISASPEDVGMRRGEFNGLGDKILEVLEDQKPVPPVLIDYLITMFYDESGDFNWRDYCLQHLGALYRNDAANGKRPQIRQLFLDAMNADVGMAGTALLALRNNIGETEITSAMLSDMAAKAALDDRQPDATRLTSMLAAAEQGNMEMLPLARSLVGTRHSTHFRMSALAVIGMLGDSSDLPMLGKYAKSSDIRLRNAAKAALKKINDRKS